MELISEWKQEKGWLKNYSSQNQIKIAKLGITLLKIKNKEIYEKNIDMIRWNIYIFGWTRYNSIETKYLFCWILIFMRKCSWKIWKFYLQKTELWYVHVEDSMWKEDAASGEVKGCAWCASELGYVQEGRWLAGEMEAAIKRCFCVN